jgi:pimeloyl-ACP methyl ester carboxylesterase
MAASGVSGYERQPTSSTKAQLEMDLFNQMEELWEKGEIDALNELEVRVWADGPGQPEGRAPETVRARVRRMNRATFQRDDGTPTALPLQPPAIGRLSEVSVPTLVLAGDLDTTDVLRLADLLAGGIRGVRKLDFPGSAHMINMEFPAEFNQALSDFLSSCHLDD